MNHSHGWFKVRRIRIFLKQGIRRVHYFELSSSKIQHPTSKMFIHYNDEHKIKLLKQQTSSSSSSSSSSSWSIMKHDSWLILNVDNNKKQMIFTVEIKFIISNADFMLFLWVTKFGIIFYAVETTEKSSNNIKMSWN